MRYWRFLLVICTVLIALVLIIPLTAQTNEANAQVIPMNDRLRLRSAPTVDSETLSYLETRTELAILQQSADGSWYKVRVITNGQEGWVASAFIEPLTEFDVPADNSQFTDTVVLGVPILTGLNENTLRIYRKGQTMGNRADVFAKVGDSITYAGYFLDPIGDGVYTLGEFGYLQGVIDYYRVTPARDENSFKQDSVAAQIGWSAHVLQNPEYADAFLCQAGETPLECEYRLTKPAVALIMLGTNDVGFVDPYAYRLNMEWIVTTSMDYGVIPVISTIPNRPDVAERVVVFNNLLREIAQKYQVPLWDYNAILADLPNSGLAHDNIHPMPAAAGYVGLANFTGENLRVGYVLRNLTALAVLDSIWRQVIQRG